MLQALLFATVAGAALIIGGALGSFWEPPRTLYAGSLAFGAGALVVGVAFELFEPAEREAGLVTASAACAGGAATFVVVDLLLERHTGDEALGLALVAAVTLDGVPENLALGVGLAEGGSVALLGAIVASNLPEAFGGAVAIRSAGRSAAYAIGLWTATAALLAVALVGGRLAAGLLSSTGIGVLSAFAAGAVLASVADSVMPEAYDEGGSAVGLASVAGFLAAFALTTVD
jgi:ZIP family zinc transporter